MSPFHFGAEFELSGPVQRRRDQASMASCGGNGGRTCQSFCYPTKDDELPSPPKPAALEEYTGDKLCSMGNQAPCSKCREEKSAWNGLCLPCLRSSLFGKFKLAVTSNAMISPRDKVLVAFSGGSASRVALQFIHELQCKSLKNWDASKSQGLAVFGVGVAFVDESSVSLNPSNVTSNILEEINTIVSELTPQKELHVTTIESIFGKNFDDGRRCLNELLDGITDATGNEDFTQYLLMLCLQKIALDNKYTKLLLGSSTSKMARLIISATVKGQGFSLPADLQYVDSRWEVPVVLPLRDCLAQELSMLCHLDGLKTLQLFDHPAAGINGLVSAFVERLQEENPSRERTIVRTGEKLKAFSFNRFTQNGYYDFLPSIIRPKFQNVNLEGSKHEFFCPICGSPLNDSKWWHHEGFQGMHQTKIEMFASQCCQSCRFQILPKDRSSLEKFYSLLPSSITNRMKDQGCADQRWLREKIEEFLINDDDR